MIEAFKQYIEQHYLCQKGEKILVAVSGGLDSIALFNLFLKTDNRIAVAHCNFSLRGNESDADEQFVADLAAKYKVDFFTKKFETKKIAEESGLSIQETARNLRYNWFDELAENHKFNHIAVAHHADDQVETFFINLFRGSGVSGLKGMPIKRGKVIRPLLFASRSEIEKYALENKLIFREDSSNSSDNYLRNRIRHNILPEIVKLSGNFKTSLNKTLGNLSEDDLLLQQFIKEKKQSLFIYKEEEILISQINLFKNEEPQALLYYVLKEFNFNRTVTDEAFNSLVEKAVGKIFFSESHQLLIDRFQLIVRKKALSAKVLHREKRHKNKSALPFKLIPDVIENKPGLVFDKSPAYAFFDFEKLKFPLLVRRWQQGDQFMPFGMKGSKLVSDFLVDIKMDRFEKEKTYVMLSQSEIIWVIGLRAAENFKVTEQTKKIYQVQLAKDNNAKG